MKKYEVIFIVLVYRNYVDLIDFYKSVEDNVSYSKRLIIVNAIYDEETTKEIHSITSSIDCDILDIENKGYSYGNNEGISFANSNYEYDYLIIANPDTIIQKFIIPSDIKSLVLAPLIRTSFGRFQNPFLVFNNKFSEHVKYIGFKMKNKLLIMFSILINKVIRVIFLFFFKYKEKQIYAGHGSFLVIHHEVINVFPRLFDDNMFLFNEEIYLAKKLYENNIKITYYPFIEIIHKEDGSLNLSKIDVSDITRNSILYLHNIDRKGDS